MHWSHVGVDADRKQDVFIVHFVLGAFCHIFNKRRLDWIGLAAFKTRCSGARVDCGNPESVRLQ